MVPYIGIYLTDLTFIEDGNPKYIDGKINFAKCRQFADVIRDIQTYQNTRYALREYDELINLLTNVDGLSDEEKFQLSLKIEPRKSKKKKKKSSSSSGAGKTKDDDEEKSSNKIDL
jgi:hypothetical protein